MNVSEVAAQTGLSPHTIRYYDQLGLLPAVQRSRGGSRQFTESDVRFLRFVIGLKKTGMSLEEIAEFTEDGCILERLQQGVMPVPAVSRRLSILQQHRERLLQQRQELDLLLEAADQKIAYYERYIGESEKR